MAERLIEHLVEEYRNSNGLHGISPQDAELLVRMHKEGVPAVYYNDPLFEKMRDDYCSDSVSERALQGENVPKHVPLAGVEGESLIKLGFVHHKDRLAPALNGLGGKISLNPAWHHWIDAYCSKHGK